MGQEFRARSAESGGELLEGDACLGVRGFFRVEGIRGSGLGCWPSLSMDLETGKAVMCSVSFGLWGVEVGD